MANVLTISSSYKAVLDTSTSVAGQMYIESALDQIVGANAGSITTSYNANKCSLTKGVVATTSVKVPVVADGFWVATPEQTGTEPGEAEDIIVIYIKHESTLGQVNTLTVYCGSIVMGVLEPGEAIQLVLGDNLSEIECKAAFYDIGVDELTATVAIIA